MALRVILLRRKLACCRQVLAEGKKTFLWAISKRIKEDGRHLDTQHQLNARESEWGFTSFMPLGEIFDPSKGYLVNDTLIVEADVVVRKVDICWRYDSKKETGFVGLKNRGATCYMNSLLQTLYHVPYFRKAIY